MDSNQDKHFTQLALVGLFFIQNITTYQFQMYKSRKLLLLHLTSVLNLLKDMSLKLQSWSMTLRLVLERSMTHLLDLTISTIQDPFFLVIRMH